LADIVTNPLFSFFNHSCDPNVKWESDKEPTNTVLFFPQGFNEAVGSIEQKKPQK
jgi:SET domain